MGFDGVEGVLGRGSLEPEPDMAMPALVQGSAGVEIFGGVVLAGDGLGGDGAPEGVAGHADFGEVEVGGEPGRSGALGLWASSASS